MLPKILQTRLFDILWDHYDAVINSFANIRNSSFRINILQSNELHVLQALKEREIVVELFSDNVYCFDRKNEYTVKGMPIFHDGSIYLQSIASMLPAIVLSPQEWDNVLDMCAAPWSKTTQIATMMKNKGKITAIEKNQIRYDKLMYNCNKQGVTIVDGYKQCAIKLLSSERFNAVFFDKILLDAPCSAEGRIHFDNEKTYKFWSTDIVSRNASIQYDLIRCAFDRLKIWWVLVYATCTLAPEENEGIITALLESHKNAKLMDIDIGFSQKNWWKTGLQKFGDSIYHPDIKKTVRILPSKETEWFFVAKITKI